MIVKYYCMECKSNVAAITNDKKIECPKCHTKNDWWLSGDIPPINHKINLLKEGE